MISCELRISFSLQTSRTALEEALHFGHAQCTKLLMRASSIAKQNVSVKCGSMVHILWEERCKGHICTILQKTFGEILLANLVKTTKLKARHLTLTPGTQG